MDLHGSTEGPRWTTTHTTPGIEGFEAAFRDGWRAFEDAAPCLDALDAAGIAFGALSNAAIDYQRQKLAACGLQRVPMLVGVDTLGFGKPDPKMFHLGCQKIGFDPADVVYVGDEFDIDGLGALDAGMQSVWLTDRLWRRTARTRRGSPMRRGRA